MFKTWSDSYPCAICVFVCLYFLFGEWSLCVCLGPQELGTPCLLQPTTLAISVGKFCSSRILPLPTPVQCWLNTFRVTEVWILLFSNIERGNGDQEVVFVGFWSWFDVFRHFPTQFVQGCSLITISIENQIKSNKNFDHVLRAIFHTYCYYNFNPWGIFARMTSFSLIRNQALDGGRKFSEIKVEKIDF